MLQSPTYRTGCCYKIRIKPGLTWATANHNNGMYRTAVALGVLLMFLTYQLLTVGYLPTVAMTGDGGLGFDSGEGAREIATTSKEGSRRVNYPILARGGSDN